MNRGEPGKSTNILDDLTTEYEAEIEDEDDPERLNACPA